MKRSVAAVAVAALVGGGAALTPAVAAAVPVASPSGRADQVAYQPPPITWGACAAPALSRRGAECGFVEVPLDYDRPRGTKIKLAVSRIRHKTPDADHQGVMLVNPGGPGGSGLVYSVFQEFIPDGAGNAYDWIGFDPRGVGSSEPRLTCDDDEYAGFARPPYVPSTPAIEKAWLTKAKNYAKACDEAGGALLDNLRTTDNVKDMDSIRRALGEERINFYGFSYGTYLGQVYGTLYPSRVRRMVFDGNVDPRKVWYRANLDQEYAFDRNIGVFFDWVAKYDAVYGLGDTGEEVEDRYYAELAKLAKEPAGGLIGAAEWNDIFVSAAYYVFGWDDVAAAFSGWVKDGDRETLRDLYGGPSPGGDNGYAIYLATECTDAPWPRTWSKWRSDAWRIHKKAPFLAWNNTWYNAPCLFWGAKAGRPVDVDGSKVGGILLISETHDAATPYEGSLEVRSRFPKSVLVEGVGGTTHSGSLSGVACVDDLIADYLATGALPARTPGRRSDVRCDPVPQPVPAGAGDGASAQWRTDDRTRQDLRPGSR